VLVELGHFCLALALSVSILQFVLPIIGIKLKSTRALATSTYSSYLFFCLVSFSFISLMWAYISSDFSVALVAQNSHSLKPLIYKVTGVWGNHEGSLMLWILVLSLYSLALSIIGKNIPLKIKSIVLSVQGLIASAFTGFILFTSNPFLRLLPPKLEGEGFNPILQDIGLAIHPPFLYLGYVGLSITFSFSIAALILKQADSIWIKWVRPWAMLSWTFLTIGIALGSWWAYRELGWGGWWFWDPVENASFMPWLAATALLHSSIVAEKRNTLKAWTILLALIAFSFSLLGTFIVRSGVLVSVHAFASDPSRGIYILLMLILFTGGSLALFAKNAPKLKSGNMFSPISREGAIVINNIIFSAAAATVLLGTLYPIFIDALTANKVSVGPPYFESVFIPLMVPAILLCGFSPMLTWKRAVFDNMYERIIFIFIVSILITSFLIYIRNGSAMTFLGIFLSIWLFLGTIYDFFERILRGKSFNEVAKRIVSYPRSAYGMSFAHIGVSIFILGATMSTAYKTEIETSVQIGDKIIVENKELIFESIKQNQGPNWLADVATFRISHNESDISFLYPERRFYPASQINTSEPAILSRLFYDLYIVLGEKDIKNKNFAVRVYYSPLLNFIWIGIAFMAFGGILSLSDKKHRVSYKTLRKNRNLSIK